MDMYLRNTFLIIFFVFIVFGTGFLWWKNKGEMQNEEVSYIPTNSEQIGYEKLTFPDNALDTSDWQTYRNKDFGFEVKYPLEWVVNEYTLAQLQDKGLSALHLESFLGGVFFDSKTYTGIDVRFYHEPVEQTIEHIEKEMPTQGEVLSNGRMIQVNNSYGRWYPLDEWEEFYDLGIYILGDTQSGYVINHAISPEGSDDAKTLQQIILSFKIVR